MELDGAAAWPGLLLACHTPRCSVLFGWLLVGCKLGRRSHRHRYADRASSNDRHSSARLILRLAAVQPAYTRSHTYNSHSSWSTTNTTNKNYKRQEKQQQQQQQRMTEQNTDGR